ncbi:hypothetical protein C0966_13035 [Bacillus methanolicus]|nr:hypothetical protein [Bacillus methanolicus]
MRRIEMAKVLGYQISETSMKLLTLLFYYRGMTALQLAKMYFKSHNPTAVQKSSVHNYLRKLKDQKLVTSKKLDGDNYVGSLYYLTQAGLEVVKSLLNIEDGQTGTGYILANENKEDTQADLEYGIYKPPMEQIHHHLILIDFFVRLRLMSNQQVDHRLSMYASKEYEYNGKEAKIRPDAEVVLPYDRHYCIEIDRATESHSQLIQKFENYRHYFEYAEEINEKLPTAIVFVTDEKQYQYGMNRRWTNVLAAYLKTMGDYALKVNLFMLPLNKVEHFIRFETYRPQLNRKVQTLLEKTLIQKGNYKDVQTFKQPTDYSSIDYMIAFTQTKYHVYFVRVAYEYDASIFSGFHHFINNLGDIHRKQQTPYKPSGVSQAIFYTDERPFLPDYMRKNYDLPQEFLSHLELLSQHLSMYKHPL